MTNVLVHLLSRSTYNDQDGSIQDLGTSRSYEHCDQAQISHCDSCEKDLAFAAASEVKDESVSEEENQNKEEEEEAKDQKWTPIRLDEDDKDSFRYANHCYHPNDFILLSPNPNSETLLDASPSDRRHTLRLAQLLSLTPALSPTPSQSPGVTNLGRASSLKVRWIVRRSETGKVGKDQTKFEREVFLTDIVEEEVDVNRLEGSFRLHHLDEIRKLTKNCNDAEASVLYDAEDPFNFFYTSKIQRRDGPPLQVSQSHEKLTSHHSQLQEIVMRPGSIERCKICKKEEEKSRNDRRRVDDKLRGNQRGRPVMKNLSLYSGGGGLDKGMGMVSLDHPLSIVIDSLTDALSYTSYRAAECSGRSKPLRPIAQLPVSSGKQRCYESVSIRADTFPSKERITMIQMSLGSQQAITSKTSSTVDEIAPFSHR